MVNGRIPSVYSKTYVTPRRPYEKARLDQELKIDRNNNFIHVRYSRPIRGKLNFPGKPCKFVQSINICKENVRNLKSMREAGEMYLIFVLLFVSN